MTRTWRIVRRLLRWTFVAVLIGGAALVALIYAVPLPDRLDAPISVAVEYRSGEIAYVFLAPDEKWRLPVELDRVDPALVAALVQLEDKRFWSHPGVDPLALLRAAWLDVRFGRRVSGGSTLSMQLARLLEPRPRTLRSKAIEMFRALQLEARLSKRQILGAYLQLAPYGANVEGIESASWAYFGHAAGHLSPAEIATLLAVPQGPARFAPSGANVARLRARRDEILGRLVAAGTFGPAAAADLATAVPADLRPFPHHATHAAIWLREHDPTARVLRSTLDAGTQLVAERIVGERTAALQRKNIHNGAVVVVDHRTRETLALVGNLDAADARHGGRIAMFGRPRSPGSTLKPFLYALAIDHGLALPGYLVADVPVAYGSYRPRNFDGTFHGLISLDEALTRSLNLPFVSLLGEVGVESFLGALEGMGVAERPGPFGLSLIVGGFELTPLELAGLYATLAEDGRYRPLRVTREAAAPAADVQAFAPGAAYLTRQALSVRDRPDFPARRQVDGLPPEIHWKTGTSFGFRDAWAVGSDREHTVVVWLGNVNNAPSTELVGSEAAGPILFDTLEALADRTRIPLPETPPDDLGWVEVCAYSGHIAGAACPKRARVLAPIHAVPTAPCPYHVAYDVDVASGEAVLPACHGDRATERRSFLVLPSGVARWLAEQHREVPGAPVFAAGCEPPGAARPPAIVSPGAGQVVVLIPGVPPSRQEVPLQAETAGGAVSWFVDGALLGTAPASTRLFWTPSPGRHDIVVADETGRKDRRTLEVR